MAAVVRGTCKIVVLRIWYVEQGAISHLLLFDTPNLKTLKTRTWALGSAQSDATCRGCVSVIRAAIHIRVDSSRSPSHDEPSQGGPPYWIDND